jgi:endonuclease YncB( thermonuclease family)
MDEIDLSLKDSRLWFYRAYVHQVVNGDTVMATVDRGFNDFAYMKLRLNGVDAPSPDPRGGSDVDRQRERKLGLLAKQRLAQLIQGREVIVRSFKTAKQDRFLADIYLPGHISRTVNSILLEEKLAVRFGTPQHWREGYS